MPKRSEAPEEEVVTDVFMDDQKQQDAREFAALVARELVKIVPDDYRIRRMIREMTLRTLAEYLGQAKAGVVRSILSACDARGVSLRLSSEGKLLARVPGKRIDADLRASIIVYRAEVIEHLRLVQEIENRTERNGRHQEGKT